MNREESINELKKIEYAIYDLLHCGKFNSNEWDLLYDIAAELNIQRLKIEKNKYIVNDYECEVNDNEFNEI